MPDQHADAPALYVTARAAARITGLNERTIRRMIARGELPATKVAPNRFTINAHDLPTPRARRRVHKRTQGDSESLASFFGELRAFQATVETLSRRVDALERRLSVLASLEWPPARAREESERVAIKDMPSIRPPRAKPPERLPSEPFLSERAMDAPNGPFTTVASVARYLTRHGINPLTPKNWLWLQAALASDGQVDADTLLRQVRAHIAAVGRRGGALHVHECDRADCPCHDADIWA